MDPLSAHDPHLHAPALSGACASSALPETATVRRIGGDLLDRLETAGHQELGALLAAAQDPHVLAASPPLDALESVIAWDLAAGF